MQPSQPTDAEAIGARLDAVKTVLHALGQELIEFQTGGDLRIDTKTTDVDLVTAADLHSEQRLVQFIQKKFPEDLILAEEGTGDLSKAAAAPKFVWILDPIDGTVNYANGLPIWVISVGLLFGGAVVGGLIEAPAIGERFEAVKNGGAFLNGKPIHVSKATKLRQGLVGTGFPYDRAQRAEPLSRGIANMLRESGGVRRLGAAALDLCYVASGRYVAYYEMALKPWDVAAGGLILTEARGTLTDLAGGPADIFASSGFAASNGTVHPALLAALVPAREAAAMQL